MIKHFNPFIGIILLVGGLLLFVEVIHMRAHQEREIDVHGWVKQYCRMNDCSQF